MSWGDAAQGATNAIRQGQKDEQDLEAALADREYKRQLILVQQAQDERLRQQMGLDRDRFGLEQQRVAAQQAKDAQQASEANNARGMRQLVFGGIQQGTATPKVGRLMLAQEGVIDPAKGLEDPDADAQRLIDRQRDMQEIQTGGRLREIAAQGAESRRTQAARPVAQPASGGVSGTNVAGLGSRAIPAAQKEDLITMGTLNDMSNQAEQLGNQIGWAGVGGLWSGSMSQLGARHLGTGTQEQQELRNLIGNITATLAKLRGGTSFTANEQALLEQYTPTINDGDKVIQAKLKSMRQFIQTKRDNTLKVIGGDLSLDDGSGGGGDIEYDINGRPVR
jgi:hypothetical protein